MSTRLHESISADLLEQIHRGDLQVGDRIPSTAELREHYGVSHVTVLNAFKVLANDGWIERQEGLGYFVRPQSPPARVATSAVLSLIRPYVQKSVMDTYLNTVNSAIQSELYRHRYQLIWPHCVSGLLASPVSADTRQAVIATARDYAPEVSGILLDERLDEATLLAIREATDVPLVLVNRGTSLPIPSIAPANRAGSQRAAQYALRLGYDTFVVCGCVQTPNLVTRTEAFREALAAQGVPAEAVRLTGGFLELDHAARVDELRRLVDGLAGSRRVLLFTPTDHLGRLICDHLIQWGYQPGQDIGLISFEALGYASLMTPHLTTVDPHPEEIGRLAVEALVSSRSMIDPTTCEAPFTLALGDTA